MASRSQRRRCATLVLLFSFATVGCTTASPAPSDSSAPPVSSEPTPVEPAAEVISAPAPVIDLDCATLADTQQLSDSVGATVTLQSRITYVDLGDDTGPSRHAMQTVGGLECEWSNGEPGRVGYERNPDFVGATARILPNADAGWASFTAYGYDTSGYGCFARDTAFECRIDRLVAGRWIEISLVGVQSEADATALADPMIASVEGAPRSADSWTAPSETLPIGDGCDSLFSVQQAQAALGTDQQIHFDGTDGGYSLTAAAWDAASANPCPWVSDGGGSLLGLGATHKVLRGGQWAFTADRQAGLAARGERTDLDGLATGDQAWLDCPDPAAACTADLLVGHNWIRIELAEDEIVDRVITGKQMALRSLAQAAVNTVRG